MLAQTSDIVHDEKGLSVTDLGEMESGGAPGRFSRIGRMPGDPPGPHALTQVRNPKSEIRNYLYDANGNMMEIDGLQCTWDFKDRLVAVENDEMRAEYTYDYTGQRITKRVTLKDPSTVNSQPSTSQVTEPFTTIYVGKHFEVRERDAPTKYIFDDETRVARVTGDLSTDLRVQRIRLWPGWNLISLAVSASLTADGVEEAIESAFRFDTGTVEWQPASPHEELPAGTILWLRAASRATFSVTGIYPGSVAPTQAPPGGIFHPGTGLEVAELDRLVPAEAAVWNFDPEQQRWQARLAPPISSLSDSLPDLAPDQGFFVHPNSDLDLLIPEHALSIRYYHQDHLGSTSVISDSEGQLVEETAYYPGGGVRNVLRSPVLSSRIPGSYYRFTQKERDAESELNYFEARYHSSTLARFLSSDPLSTLELNDQAKNLLNTPSRLNPYSYAINNFLNRIDPSGLQDLGIGDALAAAWTAEHVGVDEAREQSVRTGIASGAGVLIGLAAITAPSLVLARTAQAAHSATATTASTTTSVAARTAASGAGTAVATAAEAGITTRTLHALTLAQTGQLTSMMMAGKASGAYMIIRQVSQSPGGRESLARIQDLVVRMVPVAKDHVAASTLISLNNMLTQFTGRLGVYIYHAPSELAKELAKKVVE
ncbi:MAG TPA: RHS repeat-associated core domain-containing protein [Methylomirabilota bacterium]|nr:RHS repeat-associated core domain-containing protein [Methylomirabilota bacterium]